MSLQTYTDLSVDFYDKKYIVINSKQYDKSSRFLSITCYNRGKIFTVNSNEHSVYIRYKKSDGNSVFNFCEINRGKIIVELTEQMLASSGICYADIVIVKKGYAHVDVETGEIVAIENTAILSTMTFCINVYETAVENSDIESTHEFNMLNTNLERCWANFEEVMKTSKSYAIGDTGIRDGEDTDNAKYYYELSNAKAIDSTMSANNAKTSEDNAKISENNAKDSEINAKTSETEASSYADNAKTSEINADNYMKNAITSETNARDYSVISQRFAVGGTGFSDNEDIDNAKYYYQQTKGINDSISGSLSFKGTISFEELNTSDKFSGCAYIIKNGFTTDSTFLEGAGVEYPAGTIVYYTSDGYWACFDGFGSYVATVSEVKEYLGIE